MAARVAVAGALLGAAQFVQGSPVYANATTPAVVYTTEVVTAITTYCPAATTLTYNDKTYTVTKATTLTITDCPCTISKPVKTTTTASPPADQCAQKCYDAYNVCRSQSDANMSTCAAKYAECLGYSPFGSDGSLITPTACSSQAISTKSATKPIVYTTEVVTAITTYCPEPTTLSFNNKTYTITEPTTLTVTDCPCTIHKPSTVPSQPAEKGCPEKCYDAYNACRGRPNANMATCAAKYAECLGYSPFAGNGSLITPTACSSQIIPTKSATKPIVYTTEVVTAITTYCPEPTTLTFNNKTYTVTEPTTLTITNCPCTIHKPSTIPSQPAEKDCPEECYDAYNACRSQPDANMATCAAKYAECLGYNPLGQDGSLIKPTACSKQPGAPTSNAPGKPTGGEPASSRPNNPSGTTSSPAQATIPAKDCAAECYAAYNSCRGQPNANQSTCAAKFASCLGYSPFDNNGSLVTPTACSSGATGATVPATVPATAPATAPPSVASTPAVVHTGAAGRLTPEHLLLALGAIALM